MKYLVTMTALDTTTNTKELVGQIENQVFPSFQMLEGMEKEGMIHGGTVLAQRKIVFVAEAEGPGQLDKMVRTLPLWGMTKTEVMPLNGFAEHIAIDHAMVKKMKA